MNRPCEGKVALVSGASRGLGEAIARRLSSAGAKVAISARTLDPDPRYDGSLRETAAAIEAAGGECLPVACDLSRSEDRHALISQVTEEWGRIDILVNNAAVSFMLPYTEFPEKRWRLMVEVQLWAPYELGQMVVPGMRARGEGWILNITSRSAVHPVGPPFDKFHKDAGFSAYGMVKAGLDRMTTALAAELYDDNIAVNALAPWDNVSTPGAAHHELVDGFALEGPEWMAEAALVLCSNPPSQLTGRVAYSQPLLAEFQIRPAASA
ncbi:SDR family NAD(P)-dependent oxidoreductase [Acidiferrimicrobium sp. IK]|uniref:SDR family NAD(P)-dependent oxidoreductase n=1 Tax=Acidiferrimicrobium sp. IK TaxID=2871700 RepID=UPI0021CB52B0|nr:SDR family NAD(P)-dependent oxidoreductase [Acidiferrimicrobium sp. IK]MCU4185300.1 SDR family NAD(P)-dependent oxidoreductase [Acidiferrimicrobium sp. IK]